MTPEETVHWDVAGYALGVLDAHDTAVFEEHLASCQRCADELEALLPTVALLSDVDVDALLAAEQSQLEERAVAVGGRGADAGLATARSRWLRG